MTAQDLKAEAVQLGDGSPWAVEAVAEEVDLVQRVAVVEAEVQALEAV